MQAGTNHFKWANHNWFRKKIQIFELLGLQKFKYLYYEC